MTYFSNNHHCLALAWQYLISTRSQYCGWANCNYGSKIVPIELNYIFHDEPAKLLTNVHELLILEVVVRGITHVYLQKIISILHLQLINTEKASVMTKLHIWLLLTFIGLLVYLMFCLSHVLSEELAHIVPIVHRSSWLLVAQYKGSQW
jgi:hypothetical protein